MGPLGVLALAVSLATWAAATVHSVAAVQQLRSLWDGVYTDAQAKRGSAIYAQECARCHGATLEGSGETAGPLVGITFNSTWNGLTIGDLLDRIRLTMPVDQPGKLTRQQYVDILSYMLSVGKFPAGETELPREAERLKQIVFDPFKARPGGFAPPDPPTRSLAGTPGSPLRSRGSLAALVR